MNPIHGLWNPYHRQTHREFIPRPDHFKFWALQCSLLHPSFRYLHPSPEHYSSGGSGPPIFFPKTAKGVETTHVV